MTDTSVTEDGFTITSSHESAEQIRKGISEPKPEAPDKPEKPDPHLSEAASTLGKKGGEASAAARAKTQGKAEPSGNGQARELDSDGIGDVSGPGTPGSAEGQRDADGIADVSGPGTSGSAEGQEKPLGKPRDDPRARMLEATRQAAEAKRERDAIRAEKDRLSAELEQLRAGKTPQVQKTTAADDAEPQEADFDDYRDFVKAMARHEYRQAAKKAQREHQERQYHEGISQAVDSFTQRMNEAEKADATLREKLIPLAMQMDPSFKAKAEGRRLGPINVITDEIINSEIAPALTLHLAEHPDTFQRLLALRTPAEIQIAIAKLEGRLESQSAAPTATAPKAEVSQAKPPVRPVNGSPHTADQAPDPDSSSFDEHLRFYNAKERRAR